MRKRKQQYQKKSFESTCVSNDTSANIYMSMLLSKAWLSLSTKQQQLYLYCKAQYYAEKSKDKPEGYKEQKYFTMNKSKYSILYGLYTEGDRNGFIRDMSALIEKGFIACVFCGATSRTKSVYEYSEKWQLYGTDQFEIHPSEMNKHILNKKRKKEI